MLGNARLGLINSAALHLQVAAEVLPVAADRGALELVESISFCLAALARIRWARKPISWLGSSSS
jgi:energy-converting hydrogenase Eha subunit C